jgi:dihydrofolate synthase/folylpolyglutamate synthase
MTYSAAVAYLYRLQKHGIKLGLETMAALLQRLGNPHRRFRSIHIAGTNGKGSTAAMTAAILQAAGYRTGLYTSPHLVEFRERIRVNDVMISEAETARLTERLKGLCEPDLAATFFECTTAMAFRHFADERVDIAVLEVGLGGRFDATNVVQPMACAITTIALDHQEYLGSTLGSIAFEKAGIIKANVPVVVGPIEGEALQTIERVARAKPAPVLRLNRDFKTRGTWDSFSFSGPTVAYRGLTCALPGAHQLANAACAIALIESVGPSGVVVEEEAVRSGLTEVRWEGRIEVVEDRPTLLLDGAHNPAGAAVLADYLRSVRETRPSGRVIAVLGMMRDKDHRGFLHALKDVVDHVVLTQADLPRSATGPELKRELEDLLPPSSIAAVPSDALAIAKGMANPEDVICVTGSLMLVGEVKALLRGCGLSPLRG